jgi:hypothetical protein
MKMTMKRRVPTIDQEEFDRKVADMSATVYRSPYDEIKAYADICTELFAGWEGNLLDAGEVCARLSISDAELLELQREQKVIAFLLTDGSFDYPEEQFLADDVTPGLELVVPITLPEEIWLWLVSPCTRLIGDARPIDRLKLGAISEVVEAAEHQYLDY